MKIQYFSETDTLLVSFNEAPVEETRELDENTVLDLDARGGLVAITVEHARGRVDVSRVLVERVSALAPVET